MTSTYRTSILSVSQIKYLLSVLKYASLDQCSECDVQAVHTLAITTDRLSGLPPALS